MKSVFFLLSAAFAIAILDLYHVTQIVEIFHILQLFVVYDNP